MNILKGMTIEIVINTDQIFKSYVLLKMVDVHLLIFLPNDAIFNC